MSPATARSEEHTSELQSLITISYAVFCLKKKKKVPNTHQRTLLSALARQQRLKVLTVCTDDEAIAINAGFFFFNDPPTPEIYTVMNTLSLHDALPISPIAQHGGLGYAEQLGAFRHVESPEEPALDHQCLTWLQPGELLQGSIEAQQLVRAGRHRIGCVLEGDDRQCLPAPLLSLPSPGGFDQDLAHGARGDPLEVQARDSGESR